MKRINVIFLGLFLQVLFSAICFGQLQVSKNNVVNDSIQDAVSPCGIIECDNGDWVATFQDKGDIRTGCKTYFIRSTDQGETWSSPFLTEQGTGTNPGLMVMLYELPNGLKLASFLNVQHSSGGYAIAYTVSLYSCNDDFTTFTKLQDLSHPAGSLLSVTGNCITKLSNGDLIMPAYIYPIGTPVTGATYGSGFFRSTDGGSTWGEFELAFTESDPDNKKNFTESAFAVKPNGDIVGFARVDSTEDKYMWKVKSTDNGATWTTPVETTIAAVYPLITRLDNGKYVMICGWLDAIIPRTVSFFESEDGENYSWAGKAYYTKTGGNPYNTATGGTQAFLKTDKNKLFVTFYSRDTSQTSGVLNTYIDGNLIVDTLENNIEQELKLKILGNESSGTTAQDISSFANNGTLLNGASFSNGAVLLDGTDDRINCGNGTSLEIGLNDLTIMARVKLDSSQETYAGIVTKGASSSATAGYSLVYTVGNGKLNFLISNGTSRLWLTSDSSLNLNDNAWHTVGVTVNRDGNVIFYVDGSSVGSSSISSFSSYDIVNANNDLLIGSWVNSWHLDGMIRNVRLYRRALDSQELMDFHEEILLDMQFNEVTLSDPLDSSVYSNHGGLLNGALIGDGDGVLKLDGVNDRVNCGNDSSLDIGLNDLTILAKVKLESSQLAYAGIVTKGASSPAVSGYSLVYTVGDGKLNFLISNGTSRLWFTSNSYLNLNDGEWHTVGASVDRNGYVVFYMDGSPVGSSNISSFSSYNIVSTSNDLLIGSWVNAWHLNGVIDYVLVYKRVLTGQEILDRDN